MTTCAAAEVETFCPVCPARSRPFLTLGEHRYCVCTDLACGHVALEAIPGEGALAAFYDTPESKLWNSQAFTLLDDYLANPRAVARHLERERTRPIRRVFPRLLAPGNRVLDVGSSTGVFAATLRDRGLDACGQDIAPRAVAAGRERLDLQLFGGPIEQYRPDRPFDLITAYDVIEHVSDPRAFLRQLRRLCAPGAGLVVRTPNHAGWLRWLAGSRWLWYLPPAHIHLFTPASLTRVVAEAGFRVVRVRTDASTYLYFLAHYLRRKPAPPQVSLNMPRWKQSLIFGLDDALRLAGSPLLIFGHLRQANPLIEVYAIPR